MTWFPLVMAVLTTLTLIAVVGGVISWSLGLRGFWAVAAAPAFAMSVIALASTVAPSVGMSWSPLPVLVLSALLSTAIALVRRRWVRVSSSVSVASTRRDVIVLVASLLLGALFLAWRVAVAIGQPTNFSQTFDDVFHLNAVRYVLDTGNASSLHVGFMTSPRGTLPFYPAAWHALVSLVVEVSGVTIPVAANAVTMVISAVIWPLGAVLLTRTLFGAGRIVTVAAVVAACGIPAFPFLLIDYGVLFPYQLGLSLVPVALSATLQATGVSGVVGLPRRWWALVLAGVLPGLTLAHPGALVAVLALTVPMLAVFAWRLFRLSSSRRRVVVVAGVVAYIFVGVELLRLLRPPADARGWPPTLSLPDAIGQVVTVSMWYAVPVLAVAVAIIAGVVAACVERTRSALLVLAMYLIAALLFVVVASGTYQPLRDALTGSWYNNVPRLAAILPLVMVPLAAYGVDRLWRAARRVLPRRGVLSVVGTLTATVIAVGAVIAILAGPVVSITRSIDSLYAITADSPLISTDEYELLQRLDKHVPPDAVVAGSSWTGAGLAYALADRKVMMPHILVEESPDLDEINQQLRFATPGSAVCAAVERQHVGFVLDFGVKEIFPGRHVYPGLEDLASSDAVRLVDSQGSARLYEVVGCR